MNLSNAPATINKATVSLSGISKTYDGTTSKGDTTLSISGVNGETLSLGDATYSSKDVASNGSNFLAALTLADNGSYLASNYQLPALNLSSAPATINKATVSLSGISKTYDGTTSKGNTTLSISGVNGETLSLGDATYSDANVATAGIWRATTRFLERSM